MREIKFRGRATCSDRWVYGSYVECDGGYYIIEKLGGDSVSVAKIQVDPKTVGQQTGLKDKNGKGGYKDDKISFGSTRPIYLIKWDICNAGFYLESIDEQKEHLGIGNFTVGEIIGNVHQTEKSNEISK